MSEHQIYDFRCVDRKLTASERAELRSISTRATITSTRFHNEYNWGDLKGDPRQMLLGYFDAFFYLANWGDRWLMLKFPSSVVSAAALAPYVCSDWCVEAWERGEHTVLEVRSREGEYIEEYWEYAEALDDLLELREQLMSGDYRAPFILWLQEVAWLEEGWAEDPDFVAPPIPEGLGELDLALLELIEVFDVDHDLVEAAARLGPSSPSKRLSEARISEALGALTASQKDALLARVIRGDSRVREELIAAMRRPAANEEGADVLAILQEVSRVKQERARVAREQRERQRLERERREAEAKKVRLEALVSRWEEAWDEVYASIDERNRRGYAAAASRMVELLEASSSLESSPQDARARIGEIRDVFAQRPALMEEMDERSLP